MKSEYQTPHPDPPICATNPIKASIERKPDTL